MCFDLSSKHVSLYGLPGGDHATFAFILTKGFRWLLINVTPHWLLNHKQFRLRDQGEWTVSIFYQTIAERVNDHTNQIFFFSHEGYWV